MSGATHFAFQADIIECAKRLPHSVTITKASAFLALQGLSQYITPDSTVLASSMPAEYSFNSGAHVLKDKGPGSRPGKDCHRHGLVLIPAVKTGERGLNEYDRTCRGRSRKDMLAQALVALLVHRKAETNKHKPPNIEAESGETRPIRRSPFNQ